MSRYIDQVRIPGWDAPGGAAAFVGEEPSKSQIMILQELLLNGPTTLYGFSKKLNMPVSTAASSLEKLQDNRAIYLSDTRRENGRNKKYYSLTLRGLSMAIAWGLEGEDRDLMKSQVTQGIENWSSLCPEIFNQWKDLTNDAETSEASDYWFDFIYQVFLINTEDWGVDSKKGFFGAIALIILHRWVENLHTPDRKAADVLKGIPSVWDQIYPLLCNMKNVHLDTIKRIDALLS